MKKLMSIFAVSTSLLLTFGCSDKASVTGIENENSINENQFVRPEFIDTRPQSVIEASFVKRLDPNIETKGKPTGGTDTGGTTDPNPNPNNKYAYVIGISDYAGTQNDLSYCDDDARDWRNYLIGQGFTVRMDLDVNATSSNIEAGLTWLRDIAQEGDEIAFIYSGHGYSYNQYGSCMISTDEYYLTHSWAMQFINSSNATKTFVALDACQIGSFNSDAINGSYVATASNTSYSYDGESWMANGVWTYYFMEALNTLGYEHAEQAVPYAEQKMKAWAKKARVRVTPIHTDLYTGYFNF
jgi:hypothetical protein